jgi:hypothetical protein
LNLELALDRSSHRNRVLADVRTDNSQASFVDELAECVDRRLHTALR